MKTLIAFVAVCLVLAGLIVWYAFQVTARPPAPRDATPALPSEPTDASALGPATDSDTPPAAPAAPLTQPAAGSGRTRPAPAPTPATTTSAPTSACAGPPQPATADAAATSDVIWVESRTVAAARRLRKLNELLADDPYNHDALLEAVELAERLKLPQLEADLLKRLLRIDDAPKLRLRLAVTLMRGRRWVEAIPHLREVVDQRPDHARAWYNLAVAHQRAGHLHQALAAWNRVVALAPDNADAHANRGAVLLDLQRWEEAEAALARAAQLDPSAADVVANHSLALEHLGRAQSALEVVEAALAGQPRNLALLQRAAELCWQLAQRAEPPDAALRRRAAGYARRALEIVPDQPELRALLERIENGR